MNESGHLNVLERQEDISEKGRSVSPVKIRFEDLPKPTNLDPLEPVKFEDHKKNFNIKVVSVQKTSSEVLNSSLEEDLQEARNEYAMLLADHIKKVEEDKIKFKNLMSEFGVEKAMPVKEEPNFIKVARAKYLALLAKKRAGSKQDQISFDSDEKSKLEDEIKIDSQV